MSNPRKSMLRVAVAIAAVVTGAGVAAAQSESESALGIGAETPLTSTLSLGGGAAALVYDTGSLQIDGLVSFVSVEDGDLGFGLGARIYAEVHSGTNADLSLGGGLGIVHIDHEPDAAEDETDFLLEGGAKIRVFLAPQVAVHAVVGLGIVLADEDSDIIGLGGQLNGSLGITYFFR